MRKKWDRDRVPGSMRAVIDAYNAGDKSVGCIHISSTISIFTWIEDEPFDVLNHISGDDARARWAILNNGDRRVRCHDIVARFAEERLHFSMKEQFVFDDGATYRRSQDDNRKVARGDPEGTCGFKSNSCVIKRRGGAEPGDDVLETKRSDKHQDVAESFVTVLTNRQHKTVLEKSMTSRSSNAVDNIVSRIDQATAPSRTKAWLAAAEDIPVTGAFSKGINNYIDQKGHREFALEVANQLHDNHMVSVQALEQILKISAKQQQSHEELQQQLADISVLTEVINRMESPGQSAGNIFSGGEGTDAKTGAFDFELPIDAENLKQHLIEIFEDDPTSLTDELLKLSPEIVARGQSPVERIRNAHIQMVGRYSEMLPVFENLVKKKPDSIIFKICRDYIAMTHV